MSGVDLGKASLQAYVDSATSQFFGVASASCRLVADAIKRHGCHECHAAE